MYIRESLFYISHILLYQHVMNVCRVAYLELRRINSFRNLLSADAVKTLVCSLVLSRLDYCNSLLVPQYLIKRLKGVQNAAARSILRTPRSEHISQNLHFTPYTMLLHYVILHYLALTLNTCLTLLICFLSINELNTSVVFCYFHLPTINTTLVINKLRNLSYYLM